MLEKLGMYSKRRSPAFEPRKSALLITDMQEYFLSPESHSYVPSAPAIVGRIKELEGFYLSNNLPVVLTRHVNTKEDAKLMGAWWKELIKEDDAKSNIIKELTAPGAFVVRKSQYDAFYGTGLERLLTEQGVGQVVITGVMAHLCCDTTARAAFTRGFNVFFAIDATATYNEEFHMNALINLSHGFAIPILSGDLIAALEKL